MEEELRCPNCKQLYANPVLLPCFHALCLSCALELQIAAASAAQQATNLAQQHQQQQQQQQQQNLSSTHQQQINQLTTGVAGLTTNGSIHSHLSSVHHTGHHNHSHHSVTLSGSHHPSSSAASTASSSASTSGNESVSSDQDQADKVSILSEADSGVICCTSRPGSYAGTPNLQALLFPASSGITGISTGLLPPSTTSNTGNTTVPVIPPPGAVLALICPLSICRKIVFFDEGGVRNLPPYRAMESIVDRFCAREALKCQMCETEPKVASLVCEQCEIRYCDGCRELCHPPRGPLAKHNLVKPKGNAQIRESVCNDHGETLNLFCLGCKIPACSQCVSDNRHQSHDLQPIQQMCKAQKTELSHNLQQLSEKARSTTEFIQRLKGMSDKVTEACIEFERLVTAQCEALLQALQDRQDYLLDSIRMDRDTKIRILKEQQSSCTGKLQQTTGLIQFCIEALKETDNAAFLQVGSMLINRVANTDMTWHQEVTTAAPRVSPIVDLTLDDAALIRAIDNLNFIQMKPIKEGDERAPTAPLAPAIIPEDCSAENNSVTVAWQAPNHSFVTGYVLELDDGNGGEFREVYCGKETICTVDGLHFNSMYNARVKAFNSSGEGDYSDLIGLQTAEVAWFTFDPVLSGGPGSGLVFSKNNSTVSVEGWEHRVALGSVGFSRGIHYWEFTIDNYIADTDPAFGVARIDVNRNKMLGKDEKSFAMYIDRQRSWFQHNSVHERRVEGGITTGSTVGVLLDLERHTLSFLVNEMPQGSVAFRDLYGVFYPAVSINRGVTLTLHTALRAPRMDYY